MELDADGLVVLRRRLVAIGNAFYSIFFGKPVTSFPPASEEHKMASFFHQFTQPLIPTTHESIPQYLSEVEKEFGTQVSAEINGRHLSIHDGAILRIILSSLQLHSRRTLAAAPLFRPGTILDSALIDLQRPLYLATAKVSLSYRKKGSSTLVPAQMTITESNTFDLIPDTNPSGATSEPVWGLVLLDPLGFESGHMMDGIHPIKLKAVSYSPKVVRRKKSEPEPEPALEAVSESTDQELYTLVMPAHSSDWVTFFCTVSFNFGMWTLPANEFTKHCAGFWLKNILDELAVITDSVTTVSLANNRMEFELAESQKEFVAKGMFSSIPIKPINKFCNYMQNLELLNPDFIERARNLGSEENQKLVRDALHGFPDCLRGSLYKLLSGSDFSSDPEAREREYRRLTKLSYLYFPIGAEIGYDPTDLPESIQETLDTIPDSVWKTVLHNYGYQIPRDALGLAEFYAYLRRETDNGLYKFGSLAVARISRALDVSDLRCRTRKSTVIETATEAEETRLSYVQSMSHLIGFLVLYMSEVDAYFAMRWLIRERSLDVFFCPSMMGNFVTTGIEYGDRFNVLLAPVVFSNQIVSLGLSHREYITTNTKGFRQLESNSLSEAIVDQLFIGGSDAVFPYFLAALKQHGGNNDPDGEKILRLFQGIDERLFWKDVENPRANLFFERFIDPSEYHTYAEMEQMGMASADGMKQAAEEDAGPVANGAEPTASTSAEPAAAPLQPLFFKLSKLPVELVESRPSTPSVSPRSAPRHSLDPIDTSSLASFETAHDAANGEFTDQYMTVTEGITPDKIHEHHFDLSSKAHSNPITIPTVKSPTRTGNDIMLKKLRRASRSLRSLSVHLELQVDTLDADLQPAAIPLVKALRSVQDDISKLGAAKLTRASPVSVEQVFGLDEEDHSAHALLTQTASHIALLRTTLPQFVHACRERLSADKTDTWAMKTSKHMHKAGTETLSTVESLHGYVRAMQDEETEFDLDQWKSEVLNLDVQFAIILEDIRKMFGSTVEALSVDATPTADDAYSAETIFGRFEPLHEPSEEDEEAQHDEEDRQFLALQGSSK
eukprot:GILJ01002777.1.p1 GENE.GILJ01002777.1~~GILJ01002777.1.p1  ORF type:complete len:1210 (+),score=211.45 GILJ01002777.1:430-3630(+)